MRHPVSFYTSLLNVLAEKVADQGRAKYVAEEFFAYLAGENDVKMLGKILTRFGMRAKQKSGIASIKVEVAEEADVSDLKPKLRNALKDLYSDVVVECRVKQDLVKGMRIVIDQSYAVDVSVKDLVGSIFSG